MDPAAAFARVPSNAFLGSRLLQRSPERTEIELPVRPEFVQEEGVVHGGVLAMLADTAAVYLLWPDLPQGMTMTSIEFKVSFLGPGRPDGGPLRAVATVLRRGRSVAFCESEVLQDGRRLAKGSFTYLLRQRATDDPAAGGPRR